MSDGWSFRLLKGERGVRTGKYLLVFDIVNPEARDWDDPTEGEASDEWSLRRPEPRGGQCVGAAARGNDRQRRRDDYVVIAE